LFVRRKPRIRLEAQIHGGGHERGFRSGTLATHQIVGMGEAFRIAKEEGMNEQAQLKVLRDKLWNGLSSLEQVFLNGDAEQRIAGNINISFNFVEGESLIMALKDLAVSSGSACTSASLEPSYVLRALGLTDELAHSSIRFTIGRFTTEADIDLLLSSQKMRLINCVICHRCGICTKTVSTLAKCNGQPINNNSSSLYKGEAGRGLTSPQPSPS